MEPANRFTALRAVRPLQCLACLDSGWVIEAEQLQRCTRCERDFGLRRCQFVRGLRNARQNSLVFPQSFDAARALIRSNITRPLPVATLEIFLNTDRKGVTEAIADLRQTWRLPIADCPNGYYWKTETQKGDN